MLRGIEDSLQFDFLKRRFIVVVVGLDILVGNVGGVILQFLVKLLGEHSNAGDAHEFLELRSLIQTHLVRLMDHNQGQSHIESPAVFGREEQGRRHCLYQPLELGAGYHGLAVGWLGFAQRLACRIFLGS